MPKLISANFMKNESHCVEIMLDSVQPYVEKSYVLIDDTTTDNTKEICEARGCITKLYTFKNFGKTWNTLFDWIKDDGDWVLLIAPDETIDPEFGENVLTLIEQLNKTDVDGVWFCRRHWEDLEKKIEYTKQNWYPDWQLRLFRLAYPRIHHIHYVHEWPVGLRKSIRVQADINHFNVYWKPRINYNWEAMNKLYNELKVKQQKDGGIDIWPE